MPTRSASLRPIAADAPAVGWPEPEEVEVEVEWVRVSSVAGGGRSWKVSPAAPFC